MKRLLLPTLAVLAIAGPLRAQFPVHLGPAPGSGRLWGPSVVPFPEAPASSGILGDGSRDYRYTGFWIGAGTGAGLAYLGHQFCEDSDTDCSGTLVQGLVGTAFVVALMSTFGALIGAQFGR